MNNNVYPFFIECSKYYQDQPYKQRLLQQFAFGRGGSFIIKRKDKNILVTPDGEFVIPSIYDTAVSTCGWTPQVPTSNRDLLGGDPSEQGPATLWMGDPTAQAADTAFPSLIKKRVEEFHTARLELDQKLWKYDDYEKMQEDIKNLRIVWSTTKKKDKLYLFYKYISNLELSTNEKIILCNLITLTLLLKLVRPSDIFYKDFIIQNINQDLLTNAIIDAIEFSYDYSIPTKIKKINLIEIDDDDE
jgi:hypothetical protein